MSQEPETKVTKVVSMYKQPVTVRVVRDGKGGYRWEIEVHAEDRAKAVTLVKSIDAELRAEFLREKLQEAKAVPPCKLLKPEEKQSEGETPIVIPLRDGLGKVRLYLDYLTVEPGEDVSLAPDSPEIKELAAKVEGVRLSSTSGRISEIRIDRRVEVKELDHLIPLITRAFEKAKIQQPQTHEETKPSERPLTYKGQEVGVVKYSNDRILLIPAGPVMSDSKPLAFVLNSLKSRDIAYEVEDEQNKLRQLTVFGPLRRQHLKDLLSKIAWAFYILLKEAEKSGV